MKYMREHGWHVTMMSAAGPEIDEVVENEGCSHISIPLTRQITPFADFKALFILYRKLCAMRPDIVHSHTPKAGIVGMMAAWLARVPVRIHTVAGLPLESATGIKKRLLLGVEKLSYLAATEVWPNSQSLYDFILEHKLTSKQKLRVIGKGSSNGIDIKEFNIDSLNPILLNEVKSAFDYKDDITYLLFVGRIVKDKGVDELIKAFKILKDRHEKLELVLVGPLEAHLDPLSNDSMMAIEKDGSIHAVGFSNHVKYFMHLADLFVFPSHREGFPNVPMQAALMNCPVVASRINGNIDIIEDSVDGVLHERGNQEELIFSIDFALNNRNLMIEYAERLKYKIQNNFSRKAVQYEIALTYDKLVDSNK